MGGGTCPIVRVKTDNDDGFKEINESDFDSKIHTLFDAPKATAEKTAAKKSSKKK